MSKEKRFTDIRKWDKEWFRKLSPNQKLIWLYLCDRCSNYGVWEIDLGLMSFQIGTEITVDDIKSIGDRIQFLKEDKIYIRSFLPFHQPNRLNPNLNIHKNIVRAVNEYGLEIPENLKPLINKDEDKPVSKDTEVKVFKSNRIIKVPLNSDDAVSDKVKLMEEIFNDEQYMTEIKRLHQGKNILEGWEECYLHHSVKPSAPFHVWEWKQKLNTWLTLKRKESKTTKKYGKKESVTDLLEKFGQRYGLQQPD